MSRPDHRTFFPPSPPLSRERITGVILAGGRGRRMGGQDKGLLELDGISLAEHIARLLAPQVGPLLINANRNLERYRAFGHPVIEDLDDDFAGPLAGIASALRVCTTPLLLTVPCDAPRLPTDLALRLHQALLHKGAPVSLVHDGRRVQQAFALLRRELLPELLNYLDAGGRRLHDWYVPYGPALADFSDRPEAFVNINRLQDLEQLQNHRDR